MSCAEGEMAALRVAKKQLRSLVKHRLSLLPEDSINQQSTVATETLLPMPEYKNASRIGIYLSMPKGELSTEAIVRDAFAHGKQVFVPYLHKLKSQDRGKPVSVMDMVSLHSGSDFENLERDAWGIPTVAENSLVERQRILGTTDTENDGQERGSHNEKGSTKSEQGRLDIIIMPGVAFDRGLARLGHGKGFYDYFLERYESAKVRPMPFLVGLALDVQFLPDSQKIPTDASDWQVDALVVGDGVTIRGQEVG